MGHYQLGDCLGRGAFGSVYRGLNWMTGETVAVKQIQLGKIPRSELGEIMSEIELLRNLKHPNIVKYKGSEKTKDHLNIILEYCENGSLQSICKRFGKFPEGLVSVYISQVLEGLCYLHEQGVIHRDIKGANILTTKDGSVKLADFGVATKAGTLLDGNNPVVGSPYWMAPEVIDQSGATSASDIWSVGCVVIELLEGKPPYHFLDPMPALFRIVQDDCPPLPEGASPIVKDFLVHCFQKDANLRISAQKLCRHPWMASARRQLESMKHGGSIRGDTVYDEAVKSVQEWNDALKEPIRPGLQSRAAAVHKTDKPLVTSRKASSGRSKTDAAPRAPAIRSAVPISLLDTSKSALASSITSPGIEGGASAPAAIALVGQGRALPALHDPESLGDNWDDDFEDGISTRKLAALEKTSVDSATARRRTTASSSLAIPEVVGPTDSLVSYDAEEDNFATIRPSKRAVLPPESTTSLAKEDYSDLVSGHEEEARLETKVSQYNRQGPGGDERILHPKNLPPGRKMKSSEEGRQSMVVGNRQRQVSPSTASDSASSKQQTPRSLKRYVEDMREGDFSDIVTPDTPSLRLNMRLNGEASTAGAFDGETSNDDDDPFAEFERDVFTTSADLDANIARDKHARTCAHIVTLVERLHIQTSEEALITICDELETILTDQVHMKGQVLAAHGALAVIQLLEVIELQDVICRLLGLLNVIIYQDTLAQENLCLIGAIPVVMTFTSKRYIHEVRIEAAHFVFAMCSASSLTLQFVLSCRGLKTLVDLIDEEYQQQSDLVWLGVGCVNSVLELQSPASRNDFCRMLASEGLLEPLATALLCVIEDCQAKGMKGSVTDKMEAEGLEYALSAKHHILQIILIFSSSDSWLKEKLATRSVLRRLLQACPILEPESVAIVCKTLKNMSMCPSVLDEMENCNSIEVLTQLLALHHHGSFGTDISNQILNTMYNLCRLNKRRQEEAAQAGLIPHLVRVAQTSSPLKQFALPILCDLAHAGKSTRKLLSHECGLDFFLQLLKDPYWQLQALESILIWLQEDLAKIEAVLLRSSSIQSLLFVFTLSRSLAFEQCLDTLLKIFKLSHGITLALGKETRFVRHLMHKLRQSTKAVVKLNLLRLCKAICDLLSDPREVFEQYHLMDVLHKLAQEDAAILVREVAKEILTQLQLPPQADSAIAKEASRRVRRAASENNVSLSATSGILSVNNNGRASVINTGQEPCQDRKRSALVDHSASLRMLPTSPRRPYSARRGEEEKQAPLSRYSILVNRSRSQAGEKNDN